jgi:hypothetical protein
LGIWLPLRLGLLETSGWACPAGPLGIAKVVLILAPTEEHKSSLLTRGRREFPRACRIQGPALPPEWGSARKANLPLSRNGFAQKALSPTSAGDYHTITGAVAIGSEVF